MTVKRGWRRRLGRRGLLLAAAAVTGLALGGIAYATIPNSNKAYTACMLNNVGTVRLIDPSLPSTNPMSHCTPLETQVTWNQQGQQGAQGPKGDPGATGAAGPTGPQGPQGPKGDTGATGAAGAQGPKGDTGAAGPQGLAGKDGTSCVNADGSLASPACQGPKGDPGAAGPPGAAGKDGTSCLNADGSLASPACQGPKGDPGPAGPAGPPGPAGGGSISGVAVSSGSPATVLTIPALPPVTVSQASDGSCTLQVDTPTPNDGTHTWQVDIFSDPAAATPDTRVGQTGRTNIQGALIGSTATTGHAGGTVVLHDLNAQAVYTLGFAVGRDASTAGCWAGVTGTHT